MSIFDEIETHCEAGRLFMVEPSNEIRAHRVLPSQRRMLYVSPEIHEFLKSDRPLAAETEADFNEFILGHRFDVALELDHQFCFMARLEDSSEEVWEIRIWDTRPQLRFFGCFAGRNNFIALVGPVSRSRLAWKRYGRIKRECTTVWRHLFSYSPVAKRNDIDAYLSNVNLV